MMLGTRKQEAGRSHELVSFLKAKLCWMCDSKRFLDGS